MASVCNRTQLMRHSGPSHDLLHALRTMLEVKRRGCFLCALREVCFGGAAMAEVAISHSEIGDGCSA
eukprot:5679594-Amphidinium_carterae.1